MGTLLEPTRDAANSAIQGPNRRRKRQVCRPMTFQRYLRYMYRRTYTLYF